MRPRILWVRPIAGFGRRNVLYGIRHRLHAAHPVVQVFSASEPQYLRDPAQLTTAVKEGSQIARCSLA